ncbi:aldo/keto reductase [Aurantibacter crassamenti]|uniref:aldo/keto reductase n=1 Tax=Aurantibacter crassamenti TaxID=1837375 RepID=UPI00193A70E7|nr:aldo/keto reductase [Aurantibacter crassamenti]MBM1105299.1 aldo/keto reductase [Aurantibacter crassamenti]
MENITDLQGTFELNNGVKIPYLGLGTYQADNDNEVINAVKCALDFGYRHLDTASVYANEEGVGKGIKASSVAREDIFVVSKVWNNDQGYESTLEAFEATLQRLDVEYLDLYLIHWPVKGKYKDTWRALEKLYREKRIRAIGVSNFMKHHLEDLMQDSEITPMVNQVEFHPYLVNQDLVDFCTSKGIRYEAWSPFMQGKLFKLDICKELSEKYGKSPAQIVLRWNLQKGVVTIPKSVHEERIISNADIFDFELSKEDIAQLDNFDRNERIGPDPDNFDF